MTIAEIAIASNGRYQCNYPSLITHISTDSRECENKDLFIALKGESFDGSDYALDAKRKGAYVLSNVKSVSDIYHPDTRVALLNLASNYIKTLPYILYRIGITGSVGKTTTKEFAKILLSKAFVTHASEGNFNNNIGMPLSILQAKEDTQILLMEMGMNSQGEISRLAKCLCPNIALITNIGSAHIGKLGSREKIAKAKLEILDGIDDGILLCPLEEKLLSHVKNKECFSLSDDNAEYYLRQVYDRQIEVYKNRLKYCDSFFALTELHHRFCLSAACAIAMKVGLEPSQLSYGISRISRHNTRQRVFYNEKCYFHCDCYNASRESVLSALLEFEKADFEGEKNLILGDILELGDMNEAIHFEIGKAISKDKINNLFLFGNSAEIVKLGAVTNGFPADRIFTNTDLNSPHVTAEQITEHMSLGDHFLLKASRGIRLERILDYFDIKESEANNE